MTNYDSEVDTLKHIKRVSELLNICIIHLLKRGKNHDKSKLEDPEKPIFDEMTPLLAKTTYGSEEYKESLEKMGSALKHHYAQNRHHPEHFADGINDMTLLDIIEMLMDWKAAGERHNDGNIRHSLEENKNRFDIDEQLFKILQNTVNDLGW